MLLWMAGSLASYVILVVSIRALSGSLGTYEIALVRNLGGIAICLYMLRRERDLRALAQAIPASQHFTRAAVHAIGAILILWSIAHLPLAMVSSLEFAGPLFALAFAAAFLGEKVTKVSAAACVLIAAGIAGIILLGGTRASPLLLAPLAATALLSASNVMLKRMTVTAPIALALLSMNIIQIPIFAGGALANGRWFDGFQLNLATGLGMMGVVLAGIGNQACLAKASRIGTAVQISMIDTFRIPALAFAGYALYGESIRPATLIGAVIIAIGAIAITWSRSRTAAKAAASA